ncbi:Glycosyl transferase family 1 protein isoform 2 [Hibiscus syriacus]|uniref:Glycosyl transferase family 1 protein isoform 2 n=1 Tax=Hibiscus syriacus TaxID=106335 RepID=A0A6A3BK47_HIBSY|nr:Glycosyl transferase family 1 protein isoform 2 [Hibiscus syriacus]
MFLPGSVKDKSQDSFLDDKGLVFGELRSLKEMGGLDFGEDIRLEPTKLLEKFQKANKHLNLDSPFGFNWSQHRFHYRKPQLALLHVFTLILGRSTPLKMILCAVFGEASEFHSLFLKSDRKIAVDWLNYDGILASSLEAKSVFSRGQIELVNDWKKVFSPATVVFPNYALPISSSHLKIIVLSSDSTGNYSMAVEETVEGYAFLLETVVKLPSEVAPPKVVAEHTSKLKEEWKWNLFEDFLNSTFKDRSSKILNTLEEQWNHSQREKFGSLIAMDDFFSYDIWEEEKKAHVLNAKRREEQQLKDRTDQPRGTWEDVYRNAKRADRMRNDLQKGMKGSSNGLANHYVYMNLILGKSTKGRRPGMDDIDGPSRLPLLNNPYYRDTLDEYGAFFAIANQIDRLHRNAWIGFQSWRATARKAKRSTQSPMTRSLDYITQLSP